VTDQQEDADPAASGGGAGAERDDGGEGASERAGWWRQVLERHPELEELGEELAPFATAIYFACGVVFDAVTLTQYLNSYTLAYVGMYAAGVGFFMIVRARRWFEQYRGALDGALHFCLGATFSALVALYFRSAGHVWAWVTVLLLAGVMVWNEVAARGQPRRSIVWGVYGASLVMYFNFVLPWMFGTIWSLWFYVSVAAVMGTLYGMRHVARIPDLSLTASGAFSVVLVGLYLFGAIPPVPLVMRQNIACVGAQKIRGRYVCAGEHPGVLEQLGVVSPEVYYVDGERVSLLSAVSAPRGFASALEHRWARWNGEDWKTYDTIRVEMTGGRKRGWRFYSFKRNVRPGSWRVATAVPDGRVVGYAYFDLVEVERGELPNRVRLELD